MEGAGVRFRELEGRHVDPGAHVLPWPPQLAHGLLPQPWAEKADALGGSEDLCALPEALWVREQVQLPMLRRCRAREAVHDGEVERSRSPEAPVRAPVEHRLAQFGECGVGCGSELERCDNVRARPLGEQLEWA